MAICRWVASWFIDILHASGGFGELGFVAQRGEVENHDHAFVDGGKPSRNGMTVSWPVLGGGGCNASSGTVTMSLTASTIHPPIWASIW
jgi:hypothetical protein